MLERIEKKSLSVKFILLTHAHPDHIADLERLAEENGRAGLHFRARIAPGAQTFAEGKQFDVGKLKIEARLTWGHSPGGMTFVVHGLAHPVAIVGDSLFAGSMGGGSVSYADALQQQSRENSDFA